MRTRLLAFLAVAGLVSTAPTLRAADDAMALIDKAIKAHGGAEKLGKIKAQQWSAKGKVNVMGASIEYTANYSFQEPDKLRFDFESNFNGMKLEVAAGTDGKKYWEKSGDKTREMEKKKADAFRHNLYTMHLTQLLPLKEKGFTLSLTGAEKVDGKPALGLLVSSKGRPDVTLFFDKETGLLVKSLTEMWDEFTDKTVPQETIISDYKDKDGVKVFGKLVIKRDGKTFIEEEFSDQKFLDKLDAKLFEMP
jgi:outer membrane lipoprotein-sorting protein